MFDIYLRGVKDRLLQPLLVLVPPTVTPGQLTVVGFVFGILACIAAAFSEVSYIALPLWLTNRLFDCLDCILARHRHESSELGAFYDLLCDFVIYSSIPIAVGLGQQAATGQPLDTYSWLSIAFVEATFHINNFVLFYCAAIAAKPGRGEVTSVTMKPALMEGLESGLFFTAMLIWPSYIGILCWVMGGLVVAGVVQRAWYLSEVLSRAQRKKARNNVLNRGTKSENRAG